MIAGADGITVIVLVATQPAGVVNDITTGPPLTPDTIPELLMVATELSPLLHMPPPLVVLANVMVDPWFTVERPVEGDQWINRYCHSPCNLQLRNTERYPCLTTYRLKHLYLH